MCIPYYLFFTLQNYISCYKALFLNFFNISIIAFTENENVTSDNITSSSIPSSSNTAFIKKRKLNECEAKDKQVKDEKLKSNTVKAETSKYNIAIVIFIQYFPYIFTIDNIIL